MPVRYAFGHGLSYTSFEISNLRTDREAFSDGKILKVCVDVKNTGERAGKEVVQLYVADPKRRAGRPVKELKGFEKVELQPGETKTVEFEIDARALSFYAEDLGDWFAPSGEYLLLAGDASDHISACGSVQFTTAKMLPLHLDVDTTIGELLTDPRTAPVVQQMMASRIHSTGEADGISGNPEEDAAMQNAMMQYMPLKSLMSFGVMNREQMEGFLEMLKSRM